MGNGEFGKKYREAEGSQLKAQRRAFGRWRLEV
jgi:hypothetical protein